MVTVSDEVKDNVNSYINHVVGQGRDGIRDAVQKGHDQLMHELADMSEAQAAFKPADDVWCVLEVLRHVSGAKRGTARLCTALARGETPEGRAQLGEGGSEFDTLAEARVALDERHGELIAFVDTITADTNRDATYEHPFFGPLNCAQWAAFERIHNGDHAAQVSQVKAADGYPKA